VSDLVWVAAIAAVPPTLAVLASSWKQGHENKKIAGNMVLQIGVVEGKVDEVHKLANDRLTSALDRIEQLSLVVERLRADKEKQP